MSVPCTVDSLRFGNSAQPSGCGLSHLAYVHAWLSRQREVPVPAAVEPVPVFVQVKRRGEVLCGRVVECYEWAENGQWFKVATAVGVVSVESRNVRLCSGDGRCSCDEGAAS